MIPEKANVAMLTAINKFELQSYKLPKVGPKDLLLKVEGCGVCGTDAHEYSRDPFGLIPCVLGHEGTGEIIALGENIKTDMIGEPLSVGDKLVTSIIPCGTCGPCVSNPGRSNMCENMGCYGLMADDEIHFNGWFGEYLLIREGSTFFKVNGMSVEERILIEPAAVAVHALERAKLTGLISFNSKVLVQGCGPIGLMIIAACRTMGVQNIIVVDGNDNRLELAKELGATETFNFTTFDSTAGLIEAVQGVTLGLGADFVFQCTGVTAAHTTAWQLVKRGGGLCEVGFFVDSGEAKVNPHIDFCNKEIIAVGSWAYSPQDYPITLDFMRRAKEIGLPLTKLVTDRYSLEEVDTALKKNLSMEGIKVAIINN